MDKIDRFSRIRLLFGEDFEKLQQKKVLLLGFGGVGGFCLDTLYRSGVGHICVVDCDSFEITNQNRQIGSDALGVRKVLRAKQLYENIDIVDEKITPLWVQEFDFSRYDLIIDAIDDMSAKVALALHVSDKLISSMGGAKKLDPTKIQIASIWQTKGDPLARKFRNELKKAKFDASFDVVYSDEIAKCTSLGSFVGVTGSFGLILGTLAIQKLLKN